MFGKPKTIPSKAEALPGRADQMPVPDAHFVNQHRLTPPFPDGLQRALFGMGCFWGSEKKFWSVPGVYSTAVGYAGGHTPNATYREVCTGMTGHNEVVLVVFDPKVVAYDDLLKVFWENHDPTQGMRQGNDAGTQYRSGIYYFDDAQRLAAERTRDAFQTPVEASLRAPSHHRDRAAPGLLLRRGLPPAVPREESGWLLRARRDRCHLSGGRRSKRMTTIDRRARRTRRANLLSAFFAFSAVSVFAVVSAQAPGTKTATFAGGCFWSMEHVFDELPGVVSVTVGYAGGTTKKPSYEQVEMGITGHAESIQVVYDPVKIPYERLLDAYWHNTDPTSGAGQFCDTGSQYRPIIFVADEAQKAAAERSKTTLEQSGRFKRVLTKIEQATEFWPAEAYHQHYYKTHAAAYQMYRVGCGRDARLRQLWGQGQ
jgi:peptide-methionine (S)-S-oxide reductase